LRRVGSPHDAETKGRYGYWDIGTFVSKGGRREILLETTRVSRVDAEMDDRSG